MSSFPSGVRLIAMFEASKGALVVVAGLGVMASVGEGAERAAHQLLTHLHLNPARHIARVFLAAAADVSNRQLMTYAGLAALYALSRFVEAYGLWFDRRWAEWLAAVTGGIYLPYEVVGLVRHVTPLRLTLTLLYALVVMYMVDRLRRRRSRDPTTEPQQRVDPARQERRSPARRTS
jgi:uncharacterized membrane protein (DUF2068 family)